MFWGCSLAWSEFLAGHGEGKQEDAEPRELGMHCLHSRLQILTQVRALPWLSFTLHAQDEMEDLQSWL